MADSQDDAVILPIRTSAPAVVGPVPFSAPSAPAAAEEAKSAIVVGTPAGDDAKHAANCRETIKRIRADPSGRFARLTDEIGFLATESFYVMSTYDPKRKLRWSYTVGLSWAVPSQSDLVVVFDATSPPKSMEPLLQSLARCVLTGAHDLSGAFVDKPTAVLLDVDRVCNLGLRFRSIPDQEKLLADFCFRGKSVGEALAVSMPRYVQVLWPNRTFAYPTVAAPLSYQPLL
jgi:hypothetical protein